MARLNEVFGITATVPTHTYVDRAGLDGQFSHLLGSDRHVVIYGASKQGKTSLRRKQLPEKNCVIVPCKPDHRLEDLYQEIRRQLGMKDPIGTKKVAGGDGKVQLEGSGSAGVPLMGKLEMTGAVEGAVHQSEEEEFLPVTDIGSLVALSKAINSSGKRVVIEDFHYLSEDERQRLAFDLKALWDNGTFFIIVGVWAEQNLIIVYNNDLNGRVEEIDVRWNDEDLGKVLSQGEGALRIAIDDGLKQAMIADANGNVGLLQRLAEKLCSNAGVYDTQLKPKTLDDYNTLANSRDQICHSQENRYHAFVDLVSRGFKDPERTKLKMYHHIVRVCFESSEQELLNGITRQTMLARIQQFEPEANMSVLSAALSRLNRLQAERKIFPPVLAYNNIARLRTH